MAAAIDALEAAFAAGVPPVPLRMHATTPDGELLLMPAAGPQGVGVKLISLTPANPGHGRPFVQGTYTLFDAGSQEPVASIDGAALTRGGWWCSAPACRRGPTWRGCGRCATSRTLRSSPGPARGPMPWPRSSA